MSTINTSTWRSRPRKKFSYVEGEGRVCGSCESVIPDPAGGTIQFHIGISGLDGCQRLEVQVGIDSSTGKASVALARFL